MICFHHVDNDGFCSAAIFRRAHPDAALFGIQYGDSFPWDLIRPGDEVWMVDFALQPFEDMETLKKSLGPNGRFVWIDHHQESVKEARARDFETDGLRRIGEAGCELTWEFCFPRQEFPEVVRLLGRYDVWDHEDSDVLPFQYGVLGRASEADPENDSFWQPLLDDEVIAGQRISRLIEEGRPIYRYLVHHYEYLARKRAFEIVFEGKRAIVMNTADRGRLPLESVIDPARHELAITFSRMPGKWLVGVYNAREGVDVGPICSKYGGGGHGGAGGFNCKELPFKFPSGDNRGE